LFDRGALSELEKGGFDFARLALGMSEAQKSTKGYGKSPRFSALSETVAKDLRELTSRDRALGVGMRFAHRAFDPGWLSSDVHRFELVAVVNRVDRRVFEANTCGELRLIYRLAYDTEIQGQRVQSRLPMTVNVVHFIRDADCKRVVSSFRAPFGGKEAALALTSEGGALSASRRGTLELKSIETNLQSARWPSTVRPNMAGHAEYLLRVFRPTERGSLEAAPLENTPDGERLARDAALKKEFLAWLAQADTLKNVDLGTVLVPERFLATRVTSVAPHGLSRLENRPFTRFLNEADLAFLPLRDHQHIASPKRLLRRLDGLSCNGCHQSKSVAGFHVLGRDAEDRKADALAMPHSPHFTDEVKRRKRYFEALLATAAPDEYRPMAERPAFDRGFGAHCALSTEPTFADWDCAEGFSCVRLNEPDVGQCMPKGPEAGSACEVGKMQPSADSHRDYVALGPKRSCGDGAVCEANGVGFPGGMCSMGCASLGENATCGAIAELSGFNDCLARQVPFEDCILENTRPGALRRCTHDAPCREDYVCAAMPSGEGACIPPYFLFQLRVDGHVF
jgi:hypothetical protein